MQALFQGNMTNGMKLVGVYDEEACLAIAEYLQSQHQTHHGEFQCLGDDISLMQFLPLKAPSLAHMYGEIAAENAVILLSGSLTRGLIAVGPYPDRSTALSNAVALTFGNTNNSFYAVDTAPELSEFRATLSACIHHA